MKIREFAKAHNHEVVGKLKRVKDVHYGVQNSSYPLWIDEARNEYCMSKDGKACECIVTFDGGII